MRPTEQIEAIESLIVQARGRIEVQRHAERAFPGVLEAQRANRIDTLHRAIKRLKSRRKAIVISMYKREMGTL